MWNKAYSGWAGETQPWNREWGCLSTADAAPRGYLDNARSPLLFFAFGYFCLFRAGCRSLFFTAGGFSAAGCGFRSRLLFATSFRLLNLYFFHRLLRRAFALICSTAAITPGSAVAATPPMMKYLAYGRNFFAANRPRPKIVALLPSSINILSRVFITLASSKLRILLFFSARRFAIRS
jgi:hypothetical protein